MSWAKLDDRFPDHPKVLRAGGDAAWLYVSGLCYAAGQLTDGLIPDGVLARLSDRKHPQRLAAKLIEVGLWERVDGGYRIHDYLAWNPSAQRVRDERARKARNVASFRRNQATSSAGVSGLVTGPVIDNAAVARSRLEIEARPDPVPIPSRPVLARADAGAPMTGFDLALEVWSDEWLKRYGEPYQLSPRMGLGDDSRVLQRIGEMAKQAERPATVLRNKIAGYLGDDAAWLVANRHPLRALERDWNKYGGTPAQRPGAPPEFDFSQYKSAAK